MGQVSAMTKNQELFYEHFTRGKCNGYGFTLQIIQKLNGNGRVSKGNNDNAAVPKRAIGM